MTPNKLPPLPVTDEMTLIAVDGFNEAAADGELLLTSLRDKERMRFALQDALRQSQSLPAGAVAGLSDEAMALANFFEGVRVFVTSREKIKHPEGTDLFDEHVTRLIRLATALQADAREKGEAVVTDAMVEAGIKARDDFFNNPANYYDCPTCKGRGQVDNDWCPKCGGPGEWSDITDEDGMREAITAALATQPVQASEAVVKVTDQMVERGMRPVYGDQPKDACGMRMRREIRAVLEAALSPQGELIATSSQETASE